MDANLKLQLNKNSSGSFWYFRMSKTAIEKTTEILIETEKVADKILQNKQEIIALDRRRQHSREGIREIEKNDEKKVWTTIGSLLVKLPREKALELLKKGIFF